MLSNKQAWFGFLVVLAISGAALLFQFFGTPPPVHSTEESVRGEPVHLAPGEAPSIPKAGPLAQPRSRDQIGFPAQLTQAVIPSDNPLTPKKIDLGQKLFFDGRLSADDTVACATCHDPARAFTDGRPVSIGIHGRAGQRNAPTVLNTLYNKAQFWDGRVNTLEEQAALPITNPFEMGQSSFDAAVAKIAGIEEYRRAFLNAFGRPVNGPDLLRAIAAYERTLGSFDSPFDRFIAGDKNAIDDSAKRGWELFNSRGRCNKCTQTSIETPAIISFLRPAASTALVNRSSSNALTVVRAMIGTPCRASVSSGMVGPHNSGEVAVTMVGTPNTLAAFASATRLCFSSATGMSLTPVNSPT